jgi:hypothetical protein
VTDDSDVDWTVVPVAEHADAPELVDFTGVPGADEPIVLGETQAQMGEYTDACDMLTAELIAAALPADVGTIESIEHPEELNPIPAEGEWAPNCHWEVALSGGAHSTIAIEVYVPMPELPSIDFDFVYEADSTDEAFVDLSSIGERCYLIRGIASCPFGTYAIQVITYADGEVTEDYHQATASVLASIVGRVQLL